MRVIRAGNMTWRWVEPIPGVKLEVRRLTLEEQNRLQGAKGKDDIAVVREILVRSINSWEGVAILFVDEKGKPYESDPPCDGEHRGKLLDVIVERDDRTIVPFWRLVVEALNELDAVELKN